MSRSEDGEVNGSGDPDRDAAELADRVRALLGADPALEEKRMFGTRAFLLGGRILVCVRKNGTLLVHVSHDRDDTLVVRAGASRAVMGTRTMGSGWIDVAPEVLRHDDELVYWLDVARENLAAA